MQNNLLIQLLLAVIIRLTCSLRKEKHFCYFSLQGSLAQRSNDDATAIKVPNSSANYIICSNNIFNYEFIL